MVNYSPHPFLSSDMSFFILEVSQLSLECYCEKIFSVNLDGAEGLLPLVIATKIDALLSFKTLQLIMTEFC